jgi:peptidoglycan/LPS O-acetylase OafA/YrhL
LRGYLALLVVAHHSVIWLQVKRLDGEWSPPTINVLNQLGAASVAMFFMITGFLFYPVVRGGVVATAWTRFIIRRAFRLLPPVAASVILVTLVIAGRTGNPVDRDWPLAAAKWVVAWAQPPLLGDADSGRVDAYVLWSLRYEWVFYVLVLPLCATARQLLPRSLPTAVVPASLLAIAFGARGSDSDLPLWQYLPLFATGMLVADVTRRQVAARLTGATAGGCALALFVTGAVACHDPYGYALPLFGAAFGIVAAGNDLLGLLRTRGALVLGECSFGIYLVHGVVLDVFFEDLGKTLTMFQSGTVAFGMAPIAGVIAVALAAALHIAVERPFMAMSLVCLRYYRGGLDKCGQLRAKHRERSAPPITNDLCSAETPLDLRVKNRLTDDSRMS